MFFEDRSPTIARSPYRADVACFVGFVARRTVDGGDAELGAEVVHPIESDASLWRWLTGEGWLNPPRGVAREAWRRQLEALRDVPVPIDSWELFDRLFAWERRPLVKPDGGARTATTYLGSAVRAFFAQGGRTCFVVRVGDPLPIVPPTVIRARDGEQLEAQELEALETARARRRTQLARLVPGMPFPTASPGDRDAWQGVWHLYGLPDVSYLVVPDLPDVLSTAVDWEDPPDAPPFPATFTECGPDPVPGGQEVARAVRAPRCDDEGYRIWARVLSVIASQLAARRSAGSLREVQLVASTPLPAPGSRAGVDLRRYLDELQVAHHPFDDERAPTSGPHPFRLDAEAGGAASAFVQLVHPWLRGDIAAGVPEGLAPADGTLAGLLARNALERGCYRSIGGSPVHAVVDVEPVLALAQTDDPSNPGTLAGRVTVLGPTPSGIRALSDVTTSLHDPWRQANVCRTVAAVIRALRHWGDTFAFDASSPDTWAQITHSVRDLLRQFWRAGALQGARESEAFSVRCDRTTMTQDDLDAGRVIVNVRIQPASAITRIDVVLAVSAASVALVRAA